MASNTHNTVPGFGPKVSALFVYSRPSRVQMVASMAADLCIAGVTAFAVMAGAALTAWGLLP